MKKVEKQKLKSVSGGGSNSAHILNKKKKSAVVQMISPALVSHSHKPSDSYLETE